MHVDFKQKRKIIMLSVSCIATILIIIADQLIKSIVSKNIEYITESIKVIDNFFYLVNWHNTGGAWGMMSDYTWVLSIITVVACVFFLYLIICSYSKLACTSFVLILSGAVGNVIDRIRLGYVVDYLHFNNLFGYDFPAFNLADICIVAGSIGLIISILFIKKVSLFEKGTLVDRLFGDHEKSNVVKTADVVDDDGNQDDIADIITEQSEAENE